MPARRWCRWTFGILRGRDIGAAREALFTKRLKEHGATVVPVRCPPLFKRPRGGLAATRLTLFARRPAGDAHA